MKPYQPEALVALSRYRNYFPTLGNEIQSDIYARMAELIGEERAYCDKGNYKHTAQILTSIAMYEVLQKHGKSEEDAYKGKRGLMKLGAMCCHADIIHYGNLPYTDFIRTQTLCQGGELCDFLFIRHDTDAGDGWERSASI